MQSMFSNVLSRTAAEHIRLWATRRQTLCWLVLLILRFGTVSLWRLAAHVATEARTDSVRRRFYRFFQFVRLDAGTATRLVVALLGLEGKRSKVFCGAKPTQKTDWTERGVAVGHYGFFSCGLCGVCPELPAVRSCGALERRVQRRRGAVNRGRRSVVVV